MKRYSVIWESQKQENWLVNINWYLMLYIHKFSKWPIVPEKSPINLILKVETAATSGLYKNAHSGRKIWPPSRSSQPNSQSKTHVLNLPYDIFQRLLCWHRIHNLKKKKLNICFISCFFPDSHPEKSHKKINKICNAWAQGNC